MADTRARDCAGIACSAQVLLWLIICQQLRKIVNPVMHSPYLSFNGRRLPSVALEQLRHTLSHTCVTTHPLTEQYLDLLHCQGSAECDTVADTGQ